MNIKSLVVFSALVAFALSQVQNLNYNGFTTDSSRDFQFNGDASFSNGQIVLTRSANSVAGSVFLRNSIPLTGPNGFRASFSAAFTLIMDQGAGSDGTGTGADGIVFVVNAVSNTAGGIGGGIGYYGITNSVGIEFDTWYNGELGDNDGNHVAINTGGSYRSLVQRYYTPFFNNGAPKYVWVDYNGDTQLLEVRVSEQNVRPVSAFTSATVDLVAELGRPDVYVGWTAATGGSRERHVVSAFYFTNQYAPIITSSCGNSIVESGEQCDGGACCSSTCQYASSTTTCRASNGPCDVAETCTGSSATCPTDAFASSSTTCRASNGPCDVAETCTGSSASCPADQFASSSVTCRASNGVCDVAETCTGSSSSCPTDAFASSSTTCRASAGDCDVAETCTGSSSSCPADAFRSSSTVCRASIGPCDTAETCTGNSASCRTDVSGSFETACSGLTLNINGRSTSWLNFDVISFNNFTAGTGDVEGRLAVKHSATVGNGWSVGYQLHAIPTDQTYDYSMVVGDNLSFGSGAVYPDGSNTPYRGAIENMFVGNGFQSSASYLNSRATGTCNGASGCLASQFDAVQACYGRYQNEMNSHASNVQTQVQWSGLYVTCNSASDTTYYMSLTPEQMSQYTWTQLTSCNPSARWIINIQGSGPVSFTGASFPADASQVVYNVIGSGRTINVRNINLNGNLVAPYNIVNQATSVINGKVIAADITSSWQMNRAQCFRA